MARWGFRDADIDDWNANWAHERCMARLRKQDEKEARERAAANAARSAKKASKAARGPK